MNETFLLSIATTGFVVAFAHAAIPTHWLPFVLAGRGQRWSKPKTLLVVALCGAGHVLFTTVLGILLVWLGIETSKWTGDLFPWIAGGAMITFGIYYLVRQARGDGHGHSHDHSGHKHHGEIKSINTGHGVLFLEIFEDGVRPRFRIRADGATDQLPRAATLSLATIRPDQTKQTFSFIARDGFLETYEEVPEPHEFSAMVSLSHGGHVHTHELKFEEHERNEEGELLTNSTGATATSGATDRKSDRAVIVGLLTLLTFSPCEGFLPVYLSGISYGWMGFVFLSAILAVATVVGMMAFTWLTLMGLESMRLGFLERYESGILGILILFLGVGIVFFGI